LDSYNLKLSDKIGLITLITDVSAENDPIAFREVILDAQMYVQTPNGAQVDVNMHDDGWLVTSPQMTEYTLDRIITCKRGV
jgi:hypothetical protein